MEARVVSDDHGRIVEALDALRSRWDYVFTTGGIGPTHDDITADAVAALFGVALPEHPEALAILSRRYGDEFNAARRRMARIPEAGVLIANPVTDAPGFQIGMSSSWPACPRSCRPCWRMWPRACAPAPSFMPGL